VNLQFFRQIYGYFIFLHILFGFLST